MATTTNCTSVCYSCRDIRTIASATDIGFINENFAALNDRIDKLCALLDKYITLDGLDANGQCLTNVKSCPDDPHSAVPVSAVQELIRAALAGTATQCNGCKTGCNVCSPHKYDRNCGTMIPNAY